MPSFIPKLLILVSLALRAVSGAASDVEASISFPSTNAFGRVNNGVGNNLLQVRVSNHGTEAITVTKIFGSYHTVGPREKSLKNTTTMPLRSVVKPLAKSNLIPYRFYSENKIGEVGLKVWVEYVDSNNAEYTLLGYEGAVTIVEPKGSWFDLKLLSIYAILATGLYFIFGAFNSNYIVPVTKKLAKSSKSNTSTPGKKSTVVTSFVPKVNPESGKLEKFDSDWIPKDHLHVKKAAAGGGTSGSESEGGARKRK